MAGPLMATATAVWLVDNTSLTFTQIAEFCALPTLQIEAIADDMVATKVTGRDPVAAGELTQAEIDRCQADPHASLQGLSGPEQMKKTRGPRYTPVSKRQDKPDAIAWLLRNHPEFTDTQIGKLIGSTKSTIAAIRDRTHWNISAIRPQDPVALGVCSQRDLDALVEKTAAKRGEARIDPRLEEEAQKLEEELKRMRAERLAAAAAEADANDAG